jgi:hypothetical protein
MRIIRAPRDFQRRGIAAQLNGKVGLHQTIP